MAKDAHQNLPAMIPLPPESAVTQVWPHQSVVLPLQLLTTTTDPDVT